MKKTALLICVALFAFFFIGCSDNPSNRAAKEVRRGTDTAIEATAIKGKPDDSESGRLQQAQLFESFSKAREILGSSLAKGKQAGQAADSGYLASGNLAYEQALCLRSMVAGQSEPAGRILKDISDILTQLDRLQSEHQQVTKLLDVQDTEAKQLRIILQGGKIPGVEVERAGLNAQLAEKKAELTKLQGLKAECEGRLQQEKSRENALQMQAEEKLRQAEKTSGQQKLTLEKEGYALLLERKDYLSRAMEAEDQIRGIDNQTAIVAPLAAELQRRVEQVTKQLTELENSQGKAELKGRLDAIAIQTGDSEKRLTQRADELAKLRDEYSRGIEEAVRFFAQEAVGDYQKVKERTARAYADARTADCSGQAAATYVDAMLFVENVGGGLLAAVVRAGQGQSAQTIKTVADGYTAAASDYGKKGLEKYELAVKAYQELDSYFSQIGNDYAGDVTKSHLLVLYGQKLLAEKTDSGDIVTAAETAINELQEKAKKLDPAFARSATAKLVSGQADFLPVMPVDNTAFYDSIRKQFQQWKKLKIQEQEEEVKKLLVLADELKAKYQDPEFDKVIDVEKQQLDAALVKGFKVSVSDPNMM